MHFKQILELTTNDMKSVNRIIHKNLNSEITLINEFIRYITKTGGKRLRPIIVILIAQALKNKNKQHITIAALIELIHTATLLHDDVVDTSNTRRGKKSANIVFGNAASVLVGDFIYTQAFKIMVKIKSPRILTLISKTVHTIAEGEILQLTYCNNPNITIDNYMKIIYKKTACLFEAAAQSSAILINANHDQEIALRNYGRYLGTAFQLIDDLLDYNSNTKNLGKHTGNDLNEGKATLPLLHTMQHGTIQQISLIQQAIQTGNNRHLFKKILKTMQEYGSLEYTKQCAKKEAKKAIKSLNNFTPSPYLSALKNLAYLVIYRNF